MARPSTCTPEIVEAICARIEAGQPLAQICREEGMPSVRSFLRWADEREDVAAEYARARDAHAEWLDAEVQRIAGTAKDRDSAAAARVQITALTWRASKQAPKRYGDRLDLSVDHKVDLASIIDRRRQQVLEASQKLGIAPPEQGE